MRKHTVKIDHRSLVTVLENKEIRVRLSDKNYRVGDTLVLKEHIPTVGYGNTFVAAIKSLQEIDGWIVLSMDDLPEPA